MRRLAAITLLALLSPMVHALSLNLSELNLNYKDGGGTFNVAKVKFDNEDAAAEISDYDFNIEKTGDDLQFKNFNTAFRVKKFEESLSILKGLQELNITNAGLTYSDKLFLSVDEVHTNFGRNQFNIKSLYLDCEKIAIDPIASCLNKASAEAASITLPDVFSGVLYEELLTTEPQDQQAKADMSYRPLIKNIKLSLRENNFSGSAVMKLLFNVKFYIYGKLLVDLEQKQIVIKNFTVKKGGIPVTKIVLFALKKMQIESVKIFGNTITISI